LKESLKANNAPDTDELLFAGGDVSLVIGEWVPFGANYIDLFHQKIRPGYAPTGSTFLAEERSDAADSTLFEIRRPPTELVIRDSERGRRIAFSARLGYLETGGDEQEEWVGVKLDVFGRAFYCADLASVNGCEDRLSLDSLAPVTADLVHDTSLMMTSLLTSAQNRFLELIHRGMVNDRDKYIALLADHLYRRGDDEPLGVDYDPLAYADSRAELAQLLGEIHGAARLEDDALLVWGRSGTLLFSPHWRRYERALTTYGYIHSLTDAVDNLFHGTAANDELIRSLKRRIIAGEITEASAVRQEINHLSEDITTYEVICNLLRAAVGSLQQAMGRQLDRLTPQQREIYDKLELDKRLELLTRKIADIVPTIEALELSLEGMISLVGTLQEEETDRLNKVMQFLTVVTTVAVPVTVITGWYGMNFRFMPELNWPGSYFVVIGVTVAVIIGLLFLFKRKKWF
jgi:hypothetical protein